jgi:predicted Zn-dependent peptidase
MIKPFEWTLSNDLPVVYSYDPHKTAFSCVLTAKAGAFYEPLEFPRGLAHFTEHMCFDGTRDFPEKEKLIELIDNVGGDWNGYTSNQAVTYYATVLGEDAPNALNFVSQIAIHPLLREKDVAHEKKVITEEIAGYESDPWQKVYQELNLRTSQDSRLQHDVIGTTDSIHQITLDDVKAFHQLTYSARNSVLALSGPQPVEEVRALSERYFSSMPTGDRQIDSVFSHIDCSDVIINHWQTAQHAHMVIGYDGYSAYDEKSTALALGMGIFGGGSSSRLFKYLRERDALCYMVHASTTSYQTFGSSNITSGLSVENIPLFVSSLKNEIDRFIQDGPTEDEFVREKKSALTNLLFKADSAFGLSRFYASSKLFRPDLYQIEDVANKIMSVTKDEVHEAMRAVLVQKPIISLAAKESIDSSLFDPLY